jgi:hypothetical protein
MCLTSRTLVSRLTFLPWLTKLHFHNVRGRNYMTSTTKIRSITRTLFFLKLDDKMDVAFELNHIHIYANLEKHTCKDLKI